jgi:Zn-dependent protease
MPLPYPYHQAQNSRQLNCSPAPHIIDQMHTSNIEIRDLLISWLVLGFCFDLILRRSDLPLFPDGFIVALIGLGVGFICHELSHKFVAQKLGFRAEFRLWQTGLIIALICAFISLFSPIGFLFAAPGAVYILSYTSRREGGLISLAGPSANIILALIFYAIAIHSSGLTQLIGTYGIVINLWLAAFNLLPIPPLDGSKIFAWNIPVWAMLMVISAGLLALSMFGAI